MTERRRFFPSRPAQTVPGNTVDMSVRLQRSVAASAPAAPPTSGGGDGSNGVALLVDMIPFAADSYYDPESGAPLRAVSGLRGGQIYRPVFTGWRLIGGYIGIEGPFADGDGKATLRAVAVGPEAGAVSWTWNLETPEFSPDSYMAWWDGVEVLVQDGTLKITVLPGEMETWLQPWWATLTCIATVAGVEIGRIVLRPGFNLGDIVGSLPLPV